MILIGCRYLGCEASNADRMIDHRPSSSSYREISNEERAGDRSRSCALVRRSARIDAPASPRSRDAGIPSDACQWVSARCYVSRRKRIRFRRSQPSGRARQECRSSSSPVARFSPSPSLIRHLLRAARSHRYLPEADDNERAGPRVEPSLSLTFPPFIPCT